MPRPRQQSPRPPAAGEAACWTAVQDGRARPDDWFPEHSMDKWNRQAVDICTGCPMREPCLGWALRRMEVGLLDGLPGIWGGTTQIQRIRMIRRKRERDEEQRLRWRGL